MADHVHDLVEILMMAFALGMDAFSLAIGVGLKGLKRKHALQLTMWIGVFHVMMTLCGLVVGLCMHDVMGQIAVWFGSLLLMGLGLHMLLSTLFVRREITSVGTTLAAQILFSAAVSVDAFSVGISLGLRSTAYGLVSAAVFGLVGAAACASGLVIGKQANAVAGIFGELVGAVILIGYGWHLLTG